MPVYGASAGGRALCTAYALALSGRVSILLLFCARAYARASAFQSACADVDIRYSRQGFDCKPQCPRFASRAMRAIGNEAAREFKAAARPLDNGNHSDIFGSPHAAAESVYVATLNKKPRSVCERQAPEVYDWFLRLSGGGFRRFRFRLSLCGRRAFFLSVLSAASAFLASLAFLTDFSSCAGFLSYTADASTIIMTAISAPSARTDLQKRGYSRRCGRHRAERSQ